MTYDIELIVKDQYVSAQASGPSSLKSNVDFGKRVIKTCEGSGRKSVLVDVRGVTKSSGIVDFYQLAKEVSSLAQGKISKCALMRRQIGDVESFTEGAMRHRGINLRSFHNEKEAISWLLSGGP